MKGKKKTHIIEEEKQSNPNCCSLTAWEPGPPAAGYGRYTRHTNPRENTHRRDLSLKPGPSKKRLSLQGYLKQITSVPNPTTTSFPPKPTDLINAFVKAGSSLQVPHLTFAPCEIKVNPPQ